jgi:hypothetical protein
MKINTLKAFLIRADSFEITALSSAAVLHYLICLITSRSFKFDILFLNFPTMLKYYDQLYQIRCHL